MTFPESDLTGYARIRNAAIECFAARGVAATSIRDVAAAAGVSPGLVQHHFGTKAGLQDAVNEHVTAVAAAFAENLGRQSADGQPWTGLGDVTTAWVRDNAVVLRYIARALVERDPRAATLFEFLVGIARTHWLGRLDDETLRPEADREWAAIHAVVFNLASVLFEGAISTQLPAPFFSPGQLRRWNHATTDLYRNGLVRTPSDTHPDRAEG